MATKNAYNRAIVKQNIAHMEQMTDWAFQQFPYYSYPVKLVVFPELCSPGFPFNTVKEALASEVPETVPGETTDRLGEKAKQYGTRICPGSVMEHDPEWPGAVFNCASLIDPNGKVVLKYRKVNS